MLTLICSLLVYLCPITFLFPVTSLYDYVFSENGLVAYKNGELIHKQVSVLPPPAFKTKSVTNFPLLLFFSNFYPFHCTSSETENSLGVNLDSIISTLCKCS